MLSGFTPKAGSPWPWQSGKTDRSHVQCYETLPMLSVREPSFQTFPYRHTSLPVPHTHIHTTATSNAAWDKFQRFQLLHGHLPTTSLPQSQPKNSNLINVKACGTSRTNAGRAFKKWHASNTGGWSLPCSTRSRTGNGRSSSPNAAQRDTGTHPTQGSTD